MLLVQFKLFLGDTSKRANYVLWPNETIYPMDLQFDHRMNLAMIGRDLDATRV